MARNIHDDRVLANFVIISHTRINVSLKYTLLHFLQYRCTKVATSGLSPIPEHFHFFHVILFELKQILKNN